MAAIAALHTRLVQFDRQILHNHGIDVQGLGADTMHMARLVDTARATKGGYSLAALTEHYLQAPKITMKDRFGAPKIKKDGTEGKEIVVPSVHELHHSPDYRREWIEYSVADAVLTFDLYQELQRQLKERHWSINESDSNGHRKGEYSLFEFYEMYIVPFAECLTDMEREGIVVDCKHLLQCEHKAKQERIDADATFRKWASRHCNRSLLMVPPNHGAGRKENCRKK